MAPCLDRQMETNVTWNHLSPSKQRLYTLQILVLLSSMARQPQRLRALHPSASRPKKHGSLKFHGGEAWGRGVQGACGAYSGCILPSLVVSSLSRPRSLLIASCCLLFWRVFVRSLREHAGFKEGSLRRLRSFILAIFASKDGRRS